jgi:hypothetical protein
MGVWALIDTEMTGDSRTEKSAMERRNLEDLTIFHATKLTKILNMIRSEIPAEMGLAVVETSHCGETERIMTVLQRQETVTAMVIEWLTEAEDGEKRSAMKERKGEVKGEIAVTGLIAGTDVGTGTEISDRNVSPNGLMPKAKKRAKPIPKKISKNGWNRCKERIRLARHSLKTLLLRLIRHPHSSNWSLRRRSRHHSQLIQAQTNSLGCGPRPRKRSLQNRELRPRKKVLPRLRLLERLHASRLSSLHKKNLSDE